MATQVDKMLVAALDKLKKISSGTLTYNGNSCTVYRSAVRDYSRRMGDASYQEMYDNLFIQVETADISSWGLVPMETVVRLDGVQHVIGQTITTTGAVTTIYLRVKK